MNQLNTKQILEVCPGCHPQAQFAGKVIAVLCPIHAAEVEDWKREHRGIADREQKGE